MSGQREGARRLVGLVGALWGVGGVVWMLASAVVSLVPLALEPVRQGMSALHWAAYGGSIVFMAYSEGYRGFQRSFSPRVVARAIHLARHPRTLHLLVAPLYCMALVHARPARLGVSWGILVGVVCLVWLVRGLAQPWRGIVDAGVVIGLAWGLAALVWHAVRALSGRDPAVDPGLPAGAPRNVGP